MYSVVLLMALSGSAGSPAFGHHDGCSGCAGYASCSGCCGGYVMTCCGGSACTGCCGGCSGYASCTGCSGDCHGKTRHHFFGKHRQSHGCCGGCCGGTVISYDTCGGCSGCGGTVIAPAAPPVMEAPKKEMAPMPKGKSEEVRTPATPAYSATFVSEPMPAFEEQPAASTEPRSLGSRLWGRLRGTSAP
jgi:hypothetical protein